MTQILWERAWQERREAVSALGTLGIQNGSNVVLRYLLENGCPVDHLTGYDLCLTHDLDLIRVGMRRGVSIREPDGWASVFIRTGSRPLIRFYLEERDRIPGLAKDAVYALCTAIKESRLRAIALLRWAGVDPLGKAPRYEDWDEPESEWTGFPALSLSYAEKPEEILKLLKLKPSVRQWFDLLRDMSCGSADHIDAILALVKDPMEVIRRHPARSEWLLKSALRSICWGWSWPSGRDERLAAFCVQLIEAGVRLRWRDSSELNSCRRDFYRSSRRDLCLRILKRAAELANDDAKEELVRLVDKPRMRELVIQHQRVIMVLLSLEDPSPPYANHRRFIRSRTTAAGQRDRTSDEQQRIQPHMPESVAGRVHPIRASPMPHEVKRSGGHVLKREQIHAEIWKESATRVAARYGISGSMLARICTKLRIPRPARGYWARAQTWRNKHIQPLPVWSSEDCDYWVVNPINVKAQRISRS
ncbi:MAG: hypothetical protein WCP35_21400 [Verrucomicrobiota bacterium]